MELKTLYKIICVFEKLSRYLGTYPGTFDYNSAHVSITAKGERIVGANLIFILTWIVYVVGQTIKFKIEKNYAYYNLTFVFAVVGFLCAISFLVMFTCSRPVAPYINGCNQYTTYLHKRYKQGGTMDRKTKTILILGVVFLICSVSFALFINWILILVFPRAPMFLGYYLMPADSFNVFIYIFVVLYHGLMITVMYVNLGTIAFPVFVYCLIIFPFALKELRMGRPSYTTKDELRSLENLVKEYTCIQIIHEGIMYRIGMFIVPAQSTILMCTIFCTVVLIKYWEGLDSTSVCLFTIWALGLCGGWAVILITCAYLHLFSGKVLKSWKTSNWGSSRNNKLMKKIVASKKPLEVSFGKVYVIRMKSVLRYYQSVIRGIMRALLTLFK